MQQRHIVRVFAWSNRDLGAIITIGCRRHDSTLLTELLNNPLRMAANKKYKRIEVVQTEPKKRRGRRGISRNGTVLFVSRFIMSALYATRKTKYILSRRIELRRQRLRNRGGQSLENRTQLATRRSIATPHRCNSDSIRIMWNGTKQKQNFASTLT